MNTVRELKELGVDVYFEEQNSHPSIEKGGLFSYDFEKGECIKHYSGDYRGMKRYGNGFIALRENVGIIVYDQNLNEEKCIPTKNMEMHGLGFFSDEPNIVYVVETAKDQIGVYDIKNGIKVQEIKFSSQRYDNRHINDILVDEQYIYLSIFSLSSASGSLRTIISSFMTFTLVSLLDLGENFTLQIEETSPISSSIT